MKNKLLFLALFVGVQQIFCPENEDKQVSRDRRDLEEWMYVARENCLVM